MPWIMLWPTYHLEVIREKAYRLEIILMMLIFSLGVLNVIYSDNPNRSLSSMITFLFCGILATWVSMFLFNNAQRRDIFNWFCCFCFAVIATVEILAHSPRGPFANGLANIFTLHSIPTGTLIILLSPGPVHLILSETRKTKLLGYLVALLGALLILLTQKRGTILAVGVMVLFWVAYRFIRIRYLLAAVLLAMALLIPIKGQDFFNLLDPEIHPQASILHRLELYPFALHVWKSHPVTGMGLRPLTHEKYLSNYKQHNADLSNFPSDVKNLQTFDNMLVTSFVELGTIMTLLYFGLLGLIIGKYWFKLKSFSESPKEDFYRICVLLGFAVHSMTYDSLLFPPINWLFHVNLGIMAGYSVSEVPDHDLPLIKAVDGEAHEG